VEGVDRGAVAGRYRNVHGTVEPAFAADPKIRLAICPEAGGRAVVLVLLHFRDEHVPERCECLGIKRRGSRIIRHREADVIDHASSSSAVHAA
jgi:hypothetical protein